MAAFGKGPAPRLGVVAIDIQNIFIEAAANPDLPGILARTEKIFRIAGDKALPFFLTYEHSKEAGHAMPASLQSALPAHTEEFIKTTFAATSLPSFAEAIRKSNLSHLLLIGSETDVCVMQTALGLRAIGLEVLLSVDTIFSSEPNTAPSLKRMLLNGVSLVEMQELERLLTMPELMPRVSVARNTIFDSSSALLLGEVPAVADEWKPQKLERLRELLLFCAWLQIPVYSSGEPAVPDAVIGLSGAEAQAALKEINWQKGKLAEASSRNFFVAGSIGEWAGVIHEPCERQVFLLEDCLFGPSVLPDSVPVTYKAFFYGMRRSISESEWPSPAWKGRGDRFRPLLLPPEKLLPIHPGGRVPVRPFV